MAPVSAVTDQPSPSPVGPVASTTANDPTLNPPETARCPAGQPAVAVVPVELAGTLTGVPATIVILDVLSPPRTSGLKRDASSVPGAIFADVTDALASLADLTAEFASLSEVTDDDASFAVVTEPFGRLDAATAVPPRAITRAIIATAFPGVRWRVRGVFISSVSFRRGELQDPVRVLEGRSYNAPRTGASEGVAARTGTTAAPPVASRRVATPVRDRATWIVYASLAIYGYVLYGLGPALDALRGELHVSRGAIGLAGSAFALGAVAPALTAPAVLARAGHGTILRVGLLGLAGGTVVLVLAGPLAVIVAATFVLGVTGTLVLVVVPLVVEARQPEARAAALSEANVGAAAAGVLAPVAVGGAILVGAGWRAGALIVLGAIAVVVWIAAPGHFDVTEGPRAAADDPTGRLPRAFWRWWSLIVLVVGVEFCMAFWATDFLREEAEVGRGAASAALGLFVGGMATGRLVGGRLAVSRAPRGLLVGALALTATGFALFWSTATPLASLAGLAVTGLGVAMLFPLSLSLAMASAPGMSETASARASLAGGVAVLLAPYALATLADAIGVRLGFLIVVALLATALAVVLRAGPEGGAPAVARGTLAP